MHSHIGNECVRAGAVEDLYPSEYEIEHVGLPPSSAFEKRWAVWNVLSRPKVRERAVPYTIATTSISISSSGTTSASTATPVAQTPSLKYSARIGTVFRQSFRPT